MIIIMNKATLIFRRRIDFPDDCLLEGIVWLLLEKPVPGSQHLFKYRLYYGCEGRRDIGYDNERGKGDHKHYGEREEPYVFSTPEKLLEDFFADVKALREEASNEP